MSGVGDDGLWTAVQKLVDGALVLAQFSGTQHMHTETDVIMVRQLLQQRQNGRHLQCRTAQ